MLTLTYRDPETGTNVTFPIPLPSYLAVMLRDYVVEKLALERHRHEIGERLTSALDQI